MTNAPKNAIIIEEATEIKRGVRNEFSNEYKSAIKPNRQAEQPNRTGAAHTGQIVGKTVWGPDISDDRRT